MDIAAIASVSKYVDLKGSVGTAIAKLAMDQSEMQSLDLIRLMESSVNPSVGANLDLRV